MNNEAAAQLLAVLEKTISADQNELTAAQSFLEHAAQNNLPELLKTLSDILANVGNSAVARRQAGLQLKNRLTSNDDVVKQSYQERWLALPEEMRAYIRNNIVSALGSEGYRPSAAAQCVQGVAVVELPRNQWPDLMGHLVRNVTNPSSTEMIKEATLEAIGYICQDISDHRCLEAMSNDILTAIVHGMKKDEPSPHVRLAATNALFNSLEFTRANFEKESERHFIMQVVCEATQSTDVKVNVAALQCLVRIMSLYYQYMETYMGPALFAITLEAMKSEIDEVALQGIEFWSNVCDEEADLLIEREEAEEMNQPPEVVSRYYAKGALQFIVPILNHTLTKQEEFDDDDDWNPCKAAGVCLMLLAACCKNDIVEHVLPFVRENIKNADWRFRDAALMAFGAILEGPDSTQLQPIVVEAMPILIELLKDESVAVKDTAAWTIGRVCELNGEAALREEYLRQLLEALVAGLEAEPRVASNVCWAFTSLAEAAYENAEVPDWQESSVPPTYKLSPYFDPIVQRLLVTTDRHDAATANLRSAAYEALMEMIKNSPKDCYGTVRDTIQIVLQRLHVVLQMESNIQTQSDRLQYNDLQSLLCATLQSVLRKVEPADAPVISDTIMQSLLQMLQSSDNNKTGGVQEDALMAITSLVEALGVGFLKYMEAFKPFLLTALRNTAEYQVCHAAVGLVGDICRALSSAFQPYCADVMEVLLLNLRNDDVHRLVKPQILSVFGDIFLAVGPHFQHLFHNYMEQVLATLCQASQAQVDRSDYDNIDFLNELREGCLEAYAGIIQGLKGDGNVNQPAPGLVMLQPQVSYIVQFITVVAQDSNHSDAAVAACAGLIGDLCAAYGANILPLVDTDVISEFLTQGRRSKASKAKTLSAWATKEIRKLKNANSS